MFGPLKYEYAHGNPKDPFHFVREGEKREREERDGLSKTLLSTE